MGRCPLRIHLEDTLDNFSEGHTRRPPPPEDILQDNPKIALEDTHGEQLWRAPQKNTFWRTLLE
jgi:hypothetical protein